MRTISEMGPDCWNDTVTRMAIFDFDSEVFVVCHVLIKPGQHAGE
jgi:hypothetical protein